MEVPLIEISFSADLLYEAVDQVNQQYEKDESEYRVEVTNTTIDPKEPVFLQLKYSNGAIKQIGVVHLVRLEGPDWDARPWETMARTIDQVRDSIFTRVRLYFSAVDRGLFINEKGTVLDFKDCKVVVGKDQTFSVDGWTVTYKGKAIKIFQLASEGIIEFQRMKSGHIELTDSIDQREGKGMFIHESRIYRV